MCLRHGWHRPPSPNAEINTNKSSFCWGFFSRDMSFPAPESWQKTLFWTESHWAGWFIFLYVEGKREMIQPERQLCFKRSWRVSQRPNPPWKLYTRGPVSMQSVSLFWLVHLQDSDTWQRSDGQASRCLSAALAGLGWISLAGEVRSD